MKSKKRVAKPDALKEDSSKVRLSAKVNAKLYPVIPVSLGDLVDKLTIFEIKSKKITNKFKRF